MKKTIILLLSFSLIFSSLAPQIVYTESGNPTENNAGTFEVLSDASVYSENDHTKEIGKLVEGATLIAEKVEDGKVYIQWDEDLAYINEEKVLFIKEEAKEGFSTDDHESSGRFVVLEESEVRDSEGQVFALFLKGTEYSFMKGHKNEYEIRLGDRIGYVDKVNVREVTDDEKNTEEKLDNGNSEKKENADRNTSQNKLTDEEIEKKAAEKGRATRDEINRKGQPEHNTQFRQSIQIFSVQSSEVKFGKYFEVTEDGLTVYDNSSGSLVPIGTLVKGQEYPRVRDYGNWHEIQFGNRKGYVWKDATLPSDGKSIKNLNKSYKNSARSFKALVDLTVYDNTSGKLEPFATIHKGQQHPIVSDYGNWYRVDVSGRIGYVLRDHVAIQFTKNDQYFRVIEDSLTVYDNSTGNLKPVGTLVKGETYPRVRDYGNWHEIKFGNWYGYVWKEGTQPSDGKGIRNLNRIYRNFAGGFETLRDVTVYDNTHPSGELIPFATIREGEIYPYVSTYGQNWFRVDVSGRIGYVRSRDVTRHRIVYTPYNYTLEQMLDIQMKVNPQTDLYGGGWKKAKREDVRRYLDPNNHDMFQHLVLSKSVGAPETVLNKVLEGKGILSGKGKSFIEAGKKHGVNEIYLIAHALHETGNGKSTLATGVRYNGKTVYNMYGIGARDSCPVSCGAKKAYEEGWDTPEKAIVEGAAWIARGYINSGQDTLYKMRWNPSNPGTHQYATDIGWAVKQVSRIKNLYEQLPAFPLLFDIPKYK